MAETDTVIEDRKITFEGIFSLPDVYRLIDDHFANHGYDKHELKNVEVVRPEGKQIEILLEPRKTVTDYGRYVVNIRLVGTNLQEIEIKRDGRTVQMNQGRLQLIFNAYLVTDIESRWEEKPIYYVIRGIVNKFFYTSVNTKFKNEIKMHVTEIVNQLKAYLNLSKV